MWCELEDGTTVKVIETPSIFRPYDRALSYKTGARLPKSGLFHNFKNMPTTLSGLLKLFYSNGVRRLLPCESSLLAKLGRQK